MSMVSLIQRQLCTGKYTLSFKFQTVRTFRFLSFFFPGILGYKIHFDTNGDAEFNLTLLDMQPIGEQFFVLYKIATIISNKQISR